MKGFINIFLLILTPIISIGEISLDSLLGNRDYIITINDIPIGYMKIEREMINSSFKQKKKIEIELIRAGEKVNITTDEIIEMDRYGNLISFTYSEIDSSGEREVSGKIEDSILILNGSESGKKINMMKIEWSPDNIIDDAIQLIPIFHRDYKNLKLNVFYPQFGQFVKTNIEISNSEDNYTIICNDNMTGSEPTEYIVDNSGWLVSAYDNSFGMPLRIEIGKREITEEFDIIKEFRIKADSLKDGQRYRIYFKDLITTGLLPSGDFQNVKFINENTAEVNIQKSRIENIDKKSYLSEGSPYWAGNERLKNIINELKREKSIKKRDMARALSEWVYKNLTKKDFTIIQGDTLKALDYGGGDCSEHTYLLVGLLRTYKIPSRGVVGLLKVNDYFYYHMWVEYWDNGWIPLDPTIGTMRACHIKLFNLPPTGGMDIDSIKLLIGSLKIERIEVIEQ